MDAIGSALTGGLIGSAFLLFPALLLAARPQRGRRVKSDRRVTSRKVARVLLSVFAGCLAGLAVIASGAEAKAGLATAVSVFAVGMALATRTPRYVGTRRATAPSSTPMRVVPKRRAEQPSFAARVVVPTTAAAGTGAAIVLVTAGTASAPSAAPASDSPIQLSVTAHQTLAARPTVSKKVSAHRVRHDNVADQAGQPAAQPTATATLAHPSTPAQTPSAPSAPPTPRPTHPSATISATPAPPEETPGLLEDVNELIGGLVGGLLKP